MGKMFTIGILIGNANSPHTMELMQGIYLAGKRLNVNTIFFVAVHNQDFYHSCFVENDEANFDYQFNIVYDYTAFEKIDALIISYGTLGIFLGDGKEDFLRRFQGIPYVLLEDMTGRPDCSSIISDNYNGMYRLAEHLAADHGYQSFTFLAGPCGNRDAGERLCAFRDVMKKYGLPFDESRIEYGDFSECVESQVNRLLDRYPDMDAMVCANDLMAGTAYRQCAKRGLRIGRDIAVTGYDDWEAAGAMDPPLTTVLQDSRSMGDMAVTEALALCRGGSRQAITVPAQIRYRGSCGCSYSGGDSLHRLLNDREAYGAFMQESWFLPLISRDMMSHVDDSTEFFRSSMRKLSRLGAKNSFLYLFGQPIPHTASDTWSMPDTLYLAATQRGSDITAFPPGSQPALHRGGSLSGRQSGADSFSLSVFCLYSGQYQFGSLVTEIDPASTALFYLIAMQLGNALNFYFLADRQRRTQQRLEKLLALLGEKETVSDYPHSPDLS